MTLHRPESPPMPWSADDPRLTAYALGELTAVERRDVESNLEADPGLASEVEAIRATAAELASVWAISAQTESTDGLTAAQRAEVLAAAAKARPIIDLGRRSAPRRLRLFTAVGSFVVVAGVALLIGAPFLAEFTRNFGVASAPAPTYLESTTADRTLDTVSPAARELSEQAAGQSDDELSDQAHLRLLNFTPQPNELDAFATPAVQSPSADPSRKIIKDAALTIEIDDTTAALGRIDTIAVQSGGYVIETQTNQGIDSGRTGATIKFAVRVDSFEAALGRLRAIGTVAREQSSGVDVSQEYTDVQSRIANLEATQARVREFLAQAKSVEEALQVNARLTEIEGQLAELKGRMTYLAGRAAYSTITVTLIGPVLPTRTPTITPTATLTPTPTPGPPWSAVPIARDAFGTLRALLQGLAAVAIWLAVVGLPIALIGVAGWWAVRGIRQRGR